MERDYGLIYAGDGMIEGATKVDAYSIPSDELKDYIKKREHNIIIYVLKNT
nr:hypothetical protein [Catenibacterium mitsuokai]